MHTTLISVAELTGLLASPLSAPGVRVFDCSFDLMNPALGSQQFEQAHIPGATHASLDQHLSAHGGSVAAGTAASGGRHPLPTREAFARWLGSVGVGNGTQVVVYDRNGVNYAGRLWWMLKWCGHEAVAVLDGGLPAWTAAGQPVATGLASNPTSQPFALTVSAVALAGTTTVHDRLGQVGQTVLDARAAPRYRGEVEPLDPIAGHIPGALNRPFTTNLDTNGRFKPAATLRLEFEALLAGRDPTTVVHHCGSGVSAVPNLLAMEVAGLGRQALYAGSWSEWSNTPGLPVERG
jgi:thiosulfate/3-mercaptopyruvate sulfurtransferase